MKITVKKAYEYSSVKIEHDSTTIDLGMMDAGERDELSREFIEAMWAMGPSGNDECVAWILEIIEACGIELPNTAAHGRRSRTVQPLVGGSGLEVDHV